jgi:hypothetical protein
MENTNDKENTSDGSPLTATPGSAHPVEEFGRDAMLALLENYEAKHGRSPSVIYVTKDLEKSWRKRRLHDFSSPGKFCGMEIRRNADHISVS